MKGDEHLADEDKEPERGVGCFASAIWVCYTMNRLPQTNLKKGGLPVKRQESAEDYLETILTLEKKNGMVRSIDIVHEMGFSKPSISRAMSKLREAGQIVMDESGYIKLTESGRQRASEIYERHWLLTEYLITIGVPPEIAAEDACRIEHDLSHETFYAMREHYYKEHKNRKAQ